MPDNLFGDVLIGRDGWLFLAGGTNDVAELYLKSESFTMEMAEAWSSLVQVRQAFSQSIGARYVHVVAPEKLCIYPDMAPGFETSVLHRPAVKTAQAIAKAGISCCYLDLFDVLTGLRASTQAYMKTDTHWTFDGMRAVFQAICGRLGVFGALGDITPKLVSYESGFDLGGKFTPPILEANFFREFRPVVTRSYANPMAEIWDYNAAHGLPIAIHNSLAVSYENSDPAARDETVVLFGDSFLDFRSTTVTGLFAEAFRQVHFVWSTNVDFDHIRALKPTIIVTETAERFMRSVPKDDYDLSRDVQQNLAKLAAVG
jgi:hypothetical protein